MAISENPRDICFYTTFLNNQRQGNQGNQLTTAKGLIKSALSALIRKKTCTSPTNEERRGQFRAPRH